jgi:hypothetical protein
MFHFRFDVRPKRTHPKFGEYAGAKVCCWVQRETETEAAAVARGWIGDEHWEIIATEHADLITREAQLPDGMQYFEQAEVDGEVFTLFTSPTGAPSTAKNSKGCIPAFIFTAFSFIFAVAWALFFPLFQQKQDEPIEQESRDQVRAIMLSISEFVEQNSEDRFPSNLTEVASLTVSGTTNLQPHCSRFVYLPPPPNASKKELFGKVVLVEKLGHYKHRRGGYCGMAGDARAHFVSSDQYQTLAEKNGLSIGQLSEAAK